MALEIWHVGKKRNDEFEVLSDKYLKRLKRYLPVKMVSFKDSNAKEEVRKVEEESQSILNQVQNSDFLILMDENGKLLTTPDLSGKLSSSWLNNKRTIFLIGGAYGISKDIKERADFTLGLSKMVLPHQMARLMLVEQLYRAFTILNNENYHH